MLTFRERAQLELALLREHWWPETLRTAPASERLALEHLLATHLKEHGVIRQVLKTAEYPDEPFMHTASVDFGSHNGAGGMALNPADALRSSLAEAIERQVWAHEYTHLAAPEVMRSTSLPKHVPRISAYLCADTFRKKYSNAEVDELPFHWTRVRSLVHGRRSYAPTHLMSPHHPSLKGALAIRQTLTTGLATAPRKDMALVRALLEVIERDAFMVTWLGALVTERIQPESLAQTLPDLHTLLTRCKKLNLDVSFVHMPTDAPTYATLAVVRDPYATPPMTVGTAASPHAGVAAFKALLEALRSRRNSRADMARNPSERRARYTYWRKPDYLPQADFLTAGALRSHTPAPWEGESDGAHAKRLISWAEGRGYDVLLADLSGGKANVPGWYIYFAIIPQLHPLHQKESLRCSDLSRVHVQKPEHTNAETNLHPHPFV